MPYPREQVSDALRTNSRNSPKLPALHQLRRYHTTFASTLASLVHAPDSAYPSVVSDSCGASRSPLPSLSITRCAPSDWLWHTAALQVSDTSSVHLYSS